MNLGGPIVSAKVVSREFPTREKAVLAVNGVSLEVFQGEFLAIVGRSGSGKTSLLNLLAGLDRPTSGSVYFEGRALSELSESQLVELRRRRVGFVFQSFALLPLLSAQENVELPLHIAGVPWKERQGRAAEAIAKVGLAARARHRPYELSGGEQQRLGVARALVNNPSVVFADEATGELDTVTAEAIATLLRDLTRSQGVTMIVATHDPIVMAKADRVVTMADGSVVKHEVRTKPASMAAMP
ncbi:MAG: ABC transporter ATP-binding protein [SAR202 cluster bacterium]|nr:ABC transporter ATP-binding protein [SAR202 cluster bacterium]